MFLFEKHIHIHIHAHTRQLLDEHGGEISGCFFKETADKYHALLEVRWGGCVYAHTCLCVFARFVVVVVVYIF
jgi:hypothetical protein